MGIKKRSKVSVEFSMLFLMDIIFLLLIFFMFIFILVVLNVINFNLLGSLQKWVFSIWMLDEIRINNIGRYYYNNCSIIFNELEGQLQCFSVGKVFKLESVIIFIDKGVKVENVVVVMDLMFKFEINWVLVLEKQKRLKLF